MYRPARGGRSCERFGGYKTINRIPLPLYNTDDVQAIGAAPVDNQLGGCEKKYLNSKILRYRMIFTYLKEFGFWNVDFRYFLCHIAPSRDLPVVYL